MIVLPLLYQLFILVQELTQLWCEPNVLLLQDLVLFFNNSKEALYISSSGTPSVRSWSFASLFGCVTTWFLHLFAKGSPPISGSRSAAPSNYPPLSANLPLVNSTPPSELTYIVIVSTHYHLQVPISLSGFEVLITVVGCLNSHTVSVSWQLIGGRSLIHNFVEVQGGLAIVISKQSIQLFTRQKYWGLHINDLKLK